MTEPIAAPAKPAGPSTGILMQQILRIAAFVLAIGGFWVSAQLMKVTLDPNAPSPLLEATCGTGNSDCLSVLRSSRAMIRSGSEGGGVPWSVVGAAYFASVALWYLFVGFPTRNRWYWHIGITLVLGFAALASTHLLGVMAYELNRWCMGCTIAHGINFALLLITLAGFFFSPRSSAEAHPSFALGGATALLCLVAFAWNVGSAASIVQQRSLTQLESAYRNIVGDTDYVVWRHARQPEVDLPVEPADVLEGDPAAPNTIVAFVDLQCPACRTAHRFLRDLVTRYPGMVRVAIRHFPNSNECNAHFPLLSHPAACEAARWSIAAMQTAEASSAARYIDALYEVQDDLDLRPFESIAGQAGLDTAVLARQARDPRVEERLAADLALAHRAGVTTTPRLFLNGRPVDHWNNSAAWPRLLGIAADAATQPAVNPLDEHAAESE